MTGTTPGTSNVLETAHVVINQIMTDPPDGTNEYIVLYNPTDGPLELWNGVGTYRMDGGISYRFPSNTLIAARDTLTLVPFDPVTNTSARTAFMDAYGLAGQVYLLGPYEGRLENTGERVALERPLAPDVVGEGISWVIVDEVIYSGYEPWPTNVHATGNALQRASASQPGNDPANWVGLPAGLRPAKVFITYPKAGSTLDMPFSSSMAAVVDFSQVSGTVHRLDFYLDDVLLGSDTTAPYAVPMDYTRVDTIGLYRMRADLVDDSGTNASVEVFFRTRMADRVHIVEPADRAKVISPFSRLVRATVDMEHVKGSVHDVTFLAGNRVLCTDHTAPYEFMADRTYLPPTQWHALRAVARDDFASTTSSAVNVYIYDPIWSNRTHRMKIGFPGYTPRDPLEDFPVPVRFTEALPGFSYSQMGSATGGDLRFADHTGTNALIHEIEKWNPAGESVVWVRVPELSGSTFIWAYWGNATETDPPAGSTAVWADHELVLHLAQSAGTAPLDSSPQGRTLSFPGIAMYSWNQPGAIDGSLALNSRFTTIQDSAGIALGEGWTLSLWFRELWDNSRQRVLAELAEYHRPAVLPVSTSDLGTYTHGIGFTDSGYDLAVPAAQWQHLAVVGEGNTTTYYLNGSPVAQCVTNRVGGTLKSLGNRFGGILQESFAKGLDELRVENAARGSNWVWACYQSQRADGGFASLAAAEPQIDSELPPDADGDGLPDVWEKAYFGSTAADVDGDADGDGLNNRGEYVAGTDPTNAASVFVLDVQRSNNQIVVGFPALSAAPYGPGYSRYYSLETANNLPVPQWTEVPGYTNILGADQPVNYTSPPSRFRFFFYKARVRLEP
jgi:hypothetical protein